MSKIGDVFATLRSKGEGALIPFVTAGDPSLEDLVGVLEALALGGADLIEVGLPFSDPIADGPTIQASSQRALERGVTTEKIFETLAQFKGPPLVLMGYFNPVLRMGMNTFAQRALSVEAAATILCDVTPEESGEWIAVSQSIGLDTIFLAAPTSTADRLDQVCSSSTGFVYAVSRTGVTGSTEKGFDEAKELVARLRTRTSKPVCVGFGVRNPADVREICSFADGAIVGSSLVEFIFDRWKSGSGRNELIDKVASLKEATKSSKTK